MKELTKGKIYRKATSYSPAIDSSYIAREYSEYTVKIANILTEVDDMRAYIEYLHEIASDNGDVGIDLKEAVTSLGIALASCTTYAKEYSDEANGIDNTDDED